METLSYKINFKTYEEIRSHFIERLDERYSIKINNEEYDDIVDKKPGLIHFYPLNFNNRFISLSIKGQNVLCVYGRRSDWKKHDVYTPQRLFTCLKVDGYIPIPKKLRLAGFTHETFEKELNSVIEKVIVAADKYKEMGDKNFFKDYPIEKTLKQMARDWNSRGYMEPQFLIRYMESKYTNS